MVRSGTHLYGNPVLVHSQTPIRMEIPSARRHARTRVCSRRGRPSRPCLGDHGRIDGLDDLMAKLAEVDARFCAHRPQHARPHGAGNFVEVRDVPVVLTARTPSALALGPAEQCLLGIAGLGGGRSEGTFELGIFFAQQGQHLLAQAHPKMPGIEIRRVLHETQLQAFAQLTRLVAGAAEQGSEPGRIVLGHRRDPVQTRPADQVHEHRLRLVGRGVTEGDGRRPALFGHREQRRPSGLPRPGGQARPGLEVEPHLAMLEPETLREAAHARGLVARLRPQTMVHVPDQQLELHRAAQQITKSNQRHRVGAARAGQQQAGGPPLRQGSLQVCAHEPEGLRDAWMLSHHGLLMVPSPALSKPDRHSALHHGDIVVLTQDPLALELRDDLDQVVPQLPTQSFVRIARLLREENRLELVLPFASPEQLTAVMDLDAWREDRVDVPAAREWLTLISDTYRDAPRGDLTQLMYEMDPEFWTYSLMHATAVAELDPEDDQSRQVALGDMASLNTYETPDGNYVVGVPDNELGRAVLRVIDAVYADGLEEGRKLVSSIKWGMPSPIEEDLLRWRSGRLADLGFPAWEEAMKLFRPLAAEAARDEPGPAPVVDTSRPGEPPVPWVGGDLLKRVMARLGDAEHGVRTREFLLLVNELMAAQKLEPGDEAAQQRAINQAQATVSLGMEVLTSGFEHPDIEEFLAGRLSAIGVRGMFRVGYGPLAKLRKAAQTLHQTGRVSMNAVGSMLDRPWGPSLAALVGWYPELSLESGKTTRPLSTLADVARATLRIAQAAALANLCFEPAGYGVDPMWITRLDEPERMRLGDLLRTAIIHAHLPGSKTTFAPLLQEDLAWARDNLLTKGHIANEVREQFAANCADAGVADHTDALADNVLTRLQVELSTIELDDEGKPDLTKTGGVVSVQQVGVWLKNRTGSEPS